jgi:hypothetical protein
MFASFRVNRRDLGEFPFRTELDKGLGKHGSPDSGFSSQKAKEASRLWDKLPSTSCVFAEAVHPISQLLLNGTNPCVRLVDRFVDKMPRKQFARVKKQRISTNS